MSKIMLVIFALMVLAMLPMLFFGEKKIVSLPKFKLKQIMTKNEIEFFQRLRKSLPEYEIFPQVAIGALLDPVSANKSELIKNRNRINQKRIDYAIYSKDFELICIVELDDRTHDSKKDIERDRYFRSAGVRTIRWQSNNKPSVDQIRLSIVDILQSTFMNHAMYKSQNHDNRSATQSLVESAA